MTDSDKNAIQRDAAEYSIAPGGRRGRTKRVVAVLLAALSVPALATADDGEELVSFHCALAIDAVLAELDENSTNLVIKQALETIDDRNGQLVCIPINADEIQVRLQSTDMIASDNRLVISLDARTYAVKKIFYGR